MYGVLAPLVQANGVSRNKPCSCVRAVREGSATSGAHHHGNGDVRALTMRLRVAGTRIRTAATVRAIAIDSHEIPVSPASTWAPTASTAPIAKPMARSSAHHPLRGRTHRHTSAPGSTCVAATTSTARIAWSDGHPRPNAVRQESDSDEDEDDMPRAGPARCPALRWRRVHRARASSFWPLGWRCVVKRLGHQLFRSPLRPRRRGRRSLASPSAAVRRRGFVSRRASAAPDRLDAPAEATAGRLGLPGTRVRLPSRRPGGGPWSACAGA